MAAPFCTRILGDLGADVIKIEPPGGDPVRQWGEQVNGHSLWWSVHGRNKRSVTLDLKKSEAIEVVLKLAAVCDVVVENFRPGQLAKLGLSDDLLRAANEGLIIAHISGYGQDGPYRNRAAFGVIGEAIGGMRHLTDHAPGTSDLPPVRVGISIGDSLAGLYAALGVVAAAWQRDKVGGDGKGRTTDIALTDSVLSMMEGMLPEYGALGKIRQPVGSRIATAAPSSAYPSREGQWMLIAANSGPLFKRLCDLMGRSDLPDNPKFADNSARVKNVEELDSIIATWTRQLPIADVETRLTEAGVPCSRVYSAADCATDPQFLYRGMVRTIEDPRLGPVLHTGVVPHLPDDPGAIRWTGPAVGEHTDEVLGELLSIPVDEIADLRGKGITR